MDGLKILGKNFKCFADAPQGLSEVRRVNLIVGRNNAGKSALLDLVSFTCAPCDISNQGHKEHRPEVFVTTSLRSAEIQDIFPASTREGGVPAANWWEFGKGWIGKPITLRFDHKGERSFSSLDPPMAENGQKATFQTKLAQKAVIPLSGKAFWRMGAERDVRPEGGAGVKIEPNGHNVTGAIRYFSVEAATARLPHLENLRKDLNRLLLPEMNIAKVSTRHAGGDWEVYLDEHAKGPIPLSSSGSGLKTLLFLLAYIHLAPHISGLPLSEVVLALEEPENNLHPAVQRRLMQYLYEASKKFGFVLFVTTHSSAIIDFCAGEPETSIAQVSHDGQAASVRPIESYAERGSALDDLGVRASDLLQANGLVWLEGPSDRMYFNRWVEVWTAGRLREGAHYQCVWYGGKLAKHLSALNPGAEDAAHVSMLRVNRNALLMADSDRGNEGDVLSPTIERLMGEIRDMGGVEWVTAGREVENYIPSDVLGGLCESPLAKPLGRYEDVEEFMKDRRGKDGKRLMASKVQLAELVCPVLTKEMLVETFDLGARLYEVCERIAKWNGLTPQQVMG